jgi:hypothetical protein
MAVNSNGVFVVETADELKAWMREFHERADDVFTVPSAAVYAMLQFVESWLDTQWQPIETAPKDGTAVLTYRGPGLIAVAEFWVECGWIVPDGMEITNVTHWMPLPAPPA